MKVCVVIVVYKPNLDSLLNLIRVLLGESVLICLIDNSPFPHPLIRNISNVTYFHFPENLGVALAQNKGIEFALSSRCQYVILFDQDSVIENGFVIKSLQMIEHFNVDAAKPMIALGPSIICTFSGRKITASSRSIVKENSNLLLVKQIISSGMMINLSFIATVGTKDDLLYIDGVDHEWCWRALKKNYVIGQAKHITMQHQLGDGRGSFLGFEYKIGSPIRLYYQSRNLFLLVRRNYVPLYWKIRNLGLLMPKAYINGVLLDKKCERWQYLLKGIWDGIRGKSGSYESHWE